VRYVAANVRRSPQEDPLVRAIWPVPQRTTIPVIGSTTGVVRPSVPGVRDLPGGSFQRPVVLPPAVQRIPGGS
jgi:hypothetical protein